MCYGAATVLSDPKHSFLLVINGLYLDVVWQLACLLTQKATQGGLSQAKDSLILGESKGRGMTD